MIERPKVSVDLRHTYGRVCINNKGDMQHERESH